MLPVRTLGKTQCAGEAGEVPSLSSVLTFSPGRVIVATSKGVYILVPLPLEKQIQDLLASRRVEEALVLAKGARRNIPKEKFQVCNQPLTKQAGSHRLGGCGLLPPCSLGCLAPATQRWAVSLVTLFSGLQCRIKNTVIINWKSKVW